MKLLYTCECCKGSLHQMFGVPGRYYCPTCKQFFEKLPDGKWKEVHA